MAVTAVSGRILRTRDAIAVRRWRASQLLLRCNPLRDRDHVLRWYCWAVDRNPKTADGVSEEESDFQRIVDSIPVPFAVTISRMSVKRHAASACEDAGKPRCPHPFCRPPFPACEAAQLIATELFRAEQRWRCERRKQCTLRRRHDFSRREKTCSSSSPASNSRAVRSHSRSLRPHLSMRPPLSEDAHLPRDRFPVCAD